MTMIVLVIVFLLYSYEIYNSWWLAFIALLAVLVKFGCKMNILMMALLIVVWKVIKDLFSNRS